jgi:hypothetical protein
VITRAAFDLKTVLGGYTDEAPSQFTAIWSRIHHEQLRPASMGAKFVSGRFQKQNKIQNKRRRVILNLPVKGRVVCNGWKQETLSQRPLCVFEERQSVLVREKGLFS